MNFDQALPLLREGKILTRLAWKDKRMHVTLEQGKFYKVIPCKVAHITHVNLGYNPTPTDILADDWIKDEAE